jgi:UDP-N-acetylglucosamine 2-epimerase (non-hydrolysing)
LQKVIVVFGTRPEAIKMAPIIQRLKMDPEFDLIVCVTAQHREMLDQVLRIFEITPDYDLNAMTSGQSLAQVTATIIERLNAIIEKENPDAVLVQGDTTTAFCGALNAFYHKVKVGHVEAGLRTNNKYAPFPEELNRRLITQLADYHFAPTEYSKVALLQEGVEASKVFVTGNTAIDALLWIQKRIKEHIPEELDGFAAQLDGKQMILVTGHRRESFGEGFESICCAIREAAESYPNTAFVYPVHLNPNVKEPVTRILGRRDRIYLTKPLSYEPFVWLMNRATIVLTDSGGVQEEAPSLGKPVLVMRETTERPEGIAAGNARLVGVEKDSILSALVDLLEHPEKREAMAKVSNPYGDGRTAERICEILRKQLIRG